MPQHFALPFRLVDITFATVEQDSDEEIIACITSILRSRLGYRDDRPDLGITDPTHRQGGADLEEIREAIAKFEPRARRLIDRDPTLLPGLIDRILIRDRAAA